MWSFLFEMIELHCFLDGISGKWYNDETFQFPYIYNFTSWRVLKR